MSLSFRVVALSLLVLVLAVPSSSAQSERRYTLGKTVVFETPSETSVGWAAATTDGHYAAIALTPGRLSSILRSLGAWRARRSGPCRGAGFEAARMSPCESLGRALRYPIIGTMVGEPLGLSLGVHAGNGEESNYLLSLVGAAGTAALEGSAAAALDVPELLIVVPVAQLAAAIHLPRADRHEPSSGSENKKAETIRIS